MFGVLLLTAVATVGFVSSSPAPGYGSPHLLPSYGGAGGLHNSPIEMFHNGALHGGGYKQCLATTYYKTIYKTNFEKVPVLSTVYTPEYIPTTLYEKLIETKYSTQLVPEYIHQYHTETKYIDHYVTKTVYNTKYDTVYNTVYETELLPKYITETIFLTQYQTRLHPQYVTETKVEPVLTTKVVYKTEVIYQTKYLDRPLYEHKTFPHHEAHNQYDAPQLDEPIHKGPSGSYGVPQVSQKSPDAAYKIQDIGLKEPVDAYGAPDFSQKAIGSDYDQLGGDLKSLLNDYDAHKTDIQFSNRDYDLLNTGLDTPKTSFADSKINYNVPDKDYKVPVYIPKKAQTPVPQVVHGSYKDPEYDLGSNFKLKDHSALEFSQYDDFESLHGLGLNIKDSHTSTGNKNFRDFDFGFGGEALKVDTGLKNTKFLESLDKGIDGGKTVFDLKDFGIDESKFLEDSALLEKGTSFPSHSKLPLDTIEGHLRDQSAPKGLSEGLFSHSTGVGAQGLGSSGIFSPFDSSFLSDAGHKSRTSVLTLGGDGKLFRESRAFAASAPISAKVGGRSINYPFTSSIGLDSYQQGSSYFTSQYGASPKIARSSDDNVAYDSFKLEDAKFMPSPGFGKISDDPSYES